MKTFVGGGGEGAAVLVLGFDFCFEMSIGFFIILCCDENQAMYSRAKGRGRGKDIEGLP